MPISGYIPPGPGRNPSSDTPDAIRLPFASAYAFDLPLGPRSERGHVRGYPIDLRSKAPSSQWPPRWLEVQGSHRFVRVAQWGLGAYERYLAGEGERWLAALEPAAEYLLSNQLRSGPRDGGWPEPLPSVHTFPVPAPWLSAMAQGECASLLVRMYLETGREELAQAAVRGLRPLSVPTSQGGVQTLLRGHEFPEEYPTARPSFVLNGAIYAIWGLHDVWRGLGDQAAGDRFQAAVEMLVQNLSLWDLGYWSRYDLYPHPGVSNVAGASYHELHINQLRAMNGLEPRAELLAMAERFQSYAERRVNRVRAFLHKASFRLIVPRQPRFGARRARP
jgi:heparosan-N-sulfate-glucuronate 5-epimerase